MKQAGFFGGDSLEGIKDDLLKVELELTEAGRTCEGYKRSRLEIVRDHVGIAVKQIDTLIGKDAPGTGGGFLPGRP